MIDLKKLMEAKKKESGEMSPAQQAAKLKVLSELRGVANDEIKKDLPMKKVSVMSDSPEGLKEGLETAEEVVEEGPAAVIPGMESEESESEDHCDEVIAEAKMLSPEEKQRLIAALQEEDTSEEIV